VILHWCIDVCVQAVPSWVYTIPEPHRSRMVAEFQGKAAATPVTAAELPLTSGPSASSSVGEGGLTMPPDELGAGPAFGTGVAVPPIPPPAPVADHEGADGAEAVDEMVAALGAARKRALSKRPAAATEGTKRVGVVVAKGKGKTTAKSKAKAGATAKVKATAKATAKCAAKTTCAAKAKGAKRAVGGTLRSEDHLHTNANHHCSLSELEQIPVPSSSFDHARTASPNTSYHHSTLLVMLAQRAQPTCSIW
jgi:hypothetical protein